MRFLPQAALAAALLTLAVNAAPFDHAQGTPPEKAAKDVSIAANIKFRRVRTVPQDLPSAPAVAGEGVILDLRYAAGDARNVGVFGAWVRAHAGEKTPLVILANDETVAFVLGSLEAGKLPAGVVTVGPKSAKFSPDIEVEVKAEADRVAYDAFERGAAIEELVTPKSEKPRRDEASIMRDRGTTTSVAPSSGSREGGTGKSAGKAALEALEPVPADLVLQRGVNLLRALAALRKL